MKSNDYYWVDIITWDYIIISIRDTWYPVTVCKKLLNYKKKNVSINVQWI